MRSIFLVLLLVMTLQASACMFPAPQEQRRERSGDGGNWREDNGREQGPKDGENERAHEPRHDDRN